jgi:hypothetical protein
VRADATQRCGQSLTDRQRGGAARRKCRYAALAFQNITVVRSRTTAALLIRTEETSNYANVDAAFRPIDHKAEPREAEQHQGPRGWFGDRLDHATDDKGAKPIDRQINVGSKVAQIDDGIS